MLYNKTISFLIKLTLSQKNLAIKSLFLATIVSILEGLSTPLVMIIIQTLGGGIPNNSTSSTTFTHTLYVFYQGYPKNLQLLVIIGIFLFLTIVKNISFYSSSISINDLQLKIGRSIRRSCIERFFQLELPFYSRSNLGELISYVNEQAQRTENLSSYIIELIRELLIISVLLVVLINLSPFLTITTLISLLIGFFILKNILKNVQYYGRKVAISIDEFSTFITEVLSGIRVIKSFSSEFRELERADRCLQNRYDAEIQAFGSRAAIVPLTETVGITVLLLILSVGSVILANKGSNSLPLLLTYSYTLLRLIPRINQLNNLRSQILLLSGSLESIYNFLSSTESLHLPDGEIAYKGLSARINFQDVTFTFPSNSEPTLKNVSFQLGKGKTTAIVGSSGSGKSTLVDLVMRFHDIDSGSIKIDEYDLRDYQIKSWRKSIAMVSQDTFLFHTSLRENIAYGRPDATDLEIIEAAKKAYAYEFIQELPQGFETVVGDRGSRLSGGQRQRIAIARAILRDPDVLILDEATSALDSNSERIVQKAIEEVSQDRTVIVIAHRLSTIEKADNIVVMDNGSIVEQGTHQELLALQGKYWSLYNSQLSIDDQVIKSA